MRANIEPDDNLEDPDQHAAKQRARVWLNPPMIAAKKAFWPIESPMSNLAR